MKSSAQLSKERRESLKQQGLCINCGKQAPEINKVKCTGCLESARKASKKYVKNNPNAKEVRNRWKNNPESRAQNRETRKKWRRNYKYTVIKLLGGKCECCGDSILEFLQIDHVNKDGKKHRTEIGRSITLLRDIVKNPNRYKLRVLCANCHFAITNLGYCPHKGKDHGLPEIQQNVSHTVVARRDIG
jgi:hypothetical protein